MVKILPAHLSGAVVRKRGKRLLGPVDLDIKQGGITIVLGPNGAGKTTLLKALHGLERLREGRMDWAVPEPQARAHQGYVFQTPVMLRRSVRDNLAYPLELTHMPRAEIDAKVTEWAERIGLQDALTRRAPRLSGGEKQKLALARAMIRTPQVLFLDEPCANLDGRSTREIETLLHSAQNSGTQIVMATHNLGQARRLAARVIFVLNGQIHEDGPAEVLLDTPQTPELQAFLRGDILE